MKARQLEVLTNDQLVGHLRENNDLWEFEYTPDWVAAPHGFDLSPTLPRHLSEPAIRPKPTLHRDGATHRPVQWYFDNLLPEEALRTVIAREANLSAEDAFGLLAHFGSESAGSLVLRGPDAAGPVEHGLKPLSLADLSRRIAGLPKVSLTRDAPKRMSLAGAQHKMLVVFTGGELFEPLPGTPSTHILKPNHAEGDHYPASVMNEYFTMRLAKAVGLDVPAVHRLYVPQPVYIVERFDRTRPTPDTNPPGEASRLHAIDTCQLLNKSRAFKYTAARQDALADAVGHCRAKAAARLQIYRWLVFNVLVGNGDNHLKNISFLVDASGIKVAPAYDLLCTAVYDTKAFANERGRWPATQLAFAIGDATSFSGVTRQHLIDAGMALGLGEATARRELDRLVKAVPIEVEKLCAEIEAGVEKAVAGCPNPEAARQHIAGELHMLRAIKHIVVRDMAQQLA
jgi:serine/threonine-protein kinase HipA